METGNLVRLAGLWRGKDKNGNTYLSGKLSQIVIAWIMPNAFKKEGSNDPEYWLYLRPAKQNQKATSPQPSGPISKEASSWMATP